MKDMRRIHSKCGILGSNEMVIQPSPKRLTFEAPSVDLSQKRVHAGVPKVRRNHSHFELHRINDPPAPSMRKPLDDVAQVVTAQNAEQLNEKVGYLVRWSEWCERVVVDLTRAVSVVKVRGGRDVLRVN